MPGPRHSASTSVGTTSVVLDVPEVGDGNFTEWLNITPTNGDIWLNAWGGDATAEADNSVFVPAKVTRTFRWRATPSAAAVTGTVVVCCEGWNTHDYVADV